MMHTDTQLHTHTRPCPVTTTSLASQVELDLLATRAELLMSSSSPGFCSAFRASNLQGALHLLEELQRDPIDYQPQLRPPDARGYSEWSCSGR